MKDVAESIYDMLRFTIDIPCNYKKIKLLMFPGRFCCGYI